MLAARVSTVGLALASQYVLAHTLFVDGARFEDGILTELPASAEEAVAA